MKNDQYLPSKNNNCEMKFGNVDLQLRAFVRERRIVRLDHVPAQLFIAFLWAENNQSFVKRGHPRCENRSSPLRTDRRNEVFV